MTGLAGAVAALGLALAVQAGTAAAQGLSLSTSGASRADTFSARTRLLDTRLARQYDHSDRLRPPGAAATDQGNRVWN